VASSDVKKLQDAGVHTIEGLARASRKFLTAIKGLSEQKVEKLKGIGRLTRDERGRKANAWALGKRRERGGRWGARRGVPGLKASTD